jgi:hypothetical protein
MARVYPDSPEKQADADDNFVKAGHTLQGVEADGLHASYCTGYEGNVPTMLALMTASQLVYLAPRANEPFSGERIDG